MSLGNELGMNIPNGSDLADFFKNCGEMYGMSDKIPQDLGIFPQDFGDVNHDIGERVHVLEDEANEEFPHKLGKREGGGAPPLM